MKRSTVPSIVLLATAGTSVLVLLDINTAVRVPTVLVFAATIPGLGWAWRTRLPDPADKLLVAVTISVSLLVTVGEGMALLRMWSLPGGFLLLAVTALLGVAIPQRQRGPRADTSARRG